MDTLTSIIPVVAILGDADINNIHGYYYYSDELKYVSGYNDLFLLLWSFIVVT
jgi:hypothetical protein